MNPLSRLLQPELLIPIVAILMPIAVVALIAFFVHRMQADKHATIVNLLEKGLPVPRELLSPPRRGPTAMMRALSLIGVGVGVCGFLGAMFGPRNGLWASGLVPLAVGVAQLIAIRLERGQPEPTPSTLDS